MILFLHGTVVTMDKERRILKDHGIAVENNRIAAIMPSKELEERYPEREKVIDCRHKLILPGFIDAHAHAGHSMFKTMAYDTVSNWMAIMTEVYHHNTTDEFWYKEGKLAALERLKCGTTCGVSVMTNAQRSDNTVHGENHAKGYAEVGIREVVAIGNSNPPYPRKFSRIIDGKKVTKEYSMEDQLQNARDAIGKIHHSHNDLIRAFIAPFVMITSVNPSSLTVPDIAVGLTDADRYMTRSVQEIAREMKTRIHTEAFGGMVRLAVDDPNALLGDNVHIQHLTGISIDEAKIIAESGTHVASTPSAGQFTARCPVPELMEMGANVAITTDGTSPAAPFDLLLAAKKMQLCHQGFLHDRFYFPPGKLLEMITIDAAKALGWDDEIGSLEVGKKADIITVNMLQPHLMPSYLPIHKLILFGSGQDVWDVMVDGKILMEDRKVLSVDERAVLLEAEEEAFETIDRVKLHRFIEPCDTFWGSTRMYCKENRFEEWKKDVLADKE